MYDEKYHGPTQLSAVIVAGLMITTVLFSGVLFAEGDEAPTRADLHVGSGQTYSTIQYALDNSTDGDTIIVHEGTYSENVTVNTEITMRGLNRPVLDSGFEDCIWVRADNVTVEGFNLSTNGNGIRLDGSGFTINDNMFWHNYNGVYWTECCTIYEDVILYETSIHENEFHLTGTPLSGIFVGLNYYFDNSMDKRFEMGALTIEGNEFHMNGTGAKGIVCEFHVKGQRDGSVQIGNVTIRDNTIRGGEIGVSTSGELGESRNIDIYVGDLSVNSNILINQSGTSLNTRYYTVSYLEGDSKASLGNLSVQDNSILSDLYATGIAVQRWGGFQYLYDETDMMVGDVTISNNEIKVGETGISFSIEQLGYELYGSASLTVGDALISENDINAGGDGMQVRMYEVGAYLYDYSRIFMGNLKVNNNEVTSVSRCIYSEYFEYIGYYLYASSSFTMGDIAITENDLTSKAAFGISVDYITYINYELYDDSISMIGDILFDQNIIASHGTGVYIYYIDWCQSYLYSNNYARMGNISISGNDINSTIGTGIFLDHFENMGYYLYGSSKTVLGDIRLNDNVVWSDSEGISLSRLIYFGYELWGLSTFDMGDIEVSRNDVFSNTSLGIYSDGMSYYGSNIHDLSTVKMGDIRFDENMIRSESTGIVANSIQFFGYDNGQMSSFISGVITFDDNEIISQNDVGIIANIHDICYDLELLSYASSGGLSISGNLIHSYIDSIVLSYYNIGSYLYGSSQVEIGEFGILDNEITSSNGMGIHLGNMIDIGSNIFGSSTVEFKDISINRNEIKSNKNSIHFTNGFFWGYEVYGRSRVKMGDLLFRGNTLASGDDGIHISYFENIGSSVVDNAIVDLGGLIIADNQISSLNEGVHIIRMDFHGFWVFGHSSVEIGSIDIVDNIIYSNSSLGIHIEEMRGYGEMIFNYGDVSIDGLNVSGNEIMSNDEGVLLDSVSYWGYDLYDDASVRIGSIKANGNKLSTNGSGILLGMDLIGCNMNGDSIFEMGLVDITRNIIDSGDIGIGIGGKDLLSHNMDEYPYLELEGFRVNGNTITCSDDGIFLEVGVFMSNLNDYTSAIVGMVEISDNIIVSDNRGINATIDNIGQNNVWYPEARLGKIDMSRNDISCHSGIELELSGLDSQRFAYLGIGEVLIRENTIEDVEDVGINLTVDGKFYDRATFEMGKQVIEGNSIRNSGAEAINVTMDLIWDPAQQKVEIEPLYISTNDIINNPLGLRLEGIEKAYIFTNNFIGNGLDTGKVDSNTTWFSEDVMWYRHDGKNWSGHLGNYWDDYPGVDSDGDGIGETPYYVGLESDNYPLTSAWQDYLPPIRDITPPTIAITSPVNNSYSATDDITIEWTGEDDLLGIGRYLVRLDNGSWIDKGMANSHTFEDLSEGDHQLYLRAFDLALNPAEEWVAVHVDTISPVVTIEHPEDGGIVGPKNIMVNWSVFEEGSGLSGYSVFLDNGSAVDLGTSTEHVLTNLIGGNHSFTVYAMDLAGNQGSDSLVFYVDDEPPEIQVNHPLNGTYHNTPDITVQWIVASDVSGISLLEAGLSDGDLTELSTAVDHYDLVALSDGEYDFFIRCTDGVGNVMEEMVHFGIDTAPPQLEITRPIDGGYGAVDTIVEWTGDGTGSPISEYRVRLNEGNWSSAGTDTSYQFTSLSGLNTVYVRAADRAGNFMIRNVTFTIDDEIPTILSFSPTGDSVPVNLPVKVEFSEAMDIDTVGVLVNGKEVQVTWEGNTLSYLPAGKWNTSSSYSVNVSGADLAGNTMEAYSWSFTTSGSTELFGTLKGRLLDEDGEPIEGATVSLDTGESTETGADGTFVLVGPVGDHRLTISRSGYRTLEQDVTITEGETNVGDLQMRSKEDEKGFNSFICLIVCLLVVLAVLIILVVFVAKRKKGEGEEEDAWGGGVVVEEDEELDEEEYYDDEWGDE